MTAFFRATTRFLDRPLSGVSRGLVLLGIVEHDLNIVVDPGETKTVRFKATKAGVFPFYCTNFCSALHQEMQGYLAVKP